ncbi:MAG: hypothetical protein M3015_14875 [Bacteroidota bacterium]|nr:hypothetical protein [Bacteroidota bacterium]
MRLWFSACGALLRKLLKFGYNGFIFIAEAPNLEILINAICLLETSAGKSRAGDIVLEIKNKNASKVYNPKKVIKAYRGKRIDIMKASKAGTKAIKTKFRNKRIKHKQSTADRTFFHGKVFVSIM